MDCLTRPCQNCNKSMNGGVYRASHICPHCSHEHPSARSKRRKRLAEVAETSAAIAETTAEATVADHARVPAAETIEPEQPVQQVEVAAASAPVEAKPAVVAPVALPQKEKGKPVKDYSTSPPAQPVAPTGSKVSEIILTSQSLDEYAALDVIDTLNCERIFTVQLSPDMFNNGRFVGNKHQKVVAALAQGKKHVLSELRQKAFERGANIVISVEFKNAMKLLEDSKARIAVRASGTAARAEFTEIAMGA